MAVFQYEPYFSKDPTTNKYHPNLGWKPKEGVYDFPPYTKNGNYTKKSRRI